MLLLEFPPQSEILLKQSMAVVDNLNDCLRRMAPTSEWVWFQADDHSFEPSALKKLLDREVDVVAPLILKREPPFNTVAFKEQSDEGYWPFSLTELPETGLVHVWAAGSGGMLVRRHVLEAIGQPADKPWNERHWFTYGAGVHMNEDLVLCQRIREAGFDIYLDVEVQIGHRGSFTVVPVHEGGSWGIGLNFGQGSSGKSNTIVVRPNETKEN